MTLLLILAQAAVVAPAPAATLPAAPQGVFSYPPEFFAAARPSNALEMLARVPGFTLDTGKTVRGYEGAAGNVLIDGQRPATKRHPREAVRRRIPDGRLR